MNLTKVVLWLGVLGIFSSYEVLAKEVKMLISRKSPSVHAPVTRKKSQFRRKPAKQGLIKKRKAENTKKILVTRKRKARLIFLNDVSKHHIKRQKPITTLKIKKKATFQHIEARRVGYRIRVQKKYLQISNKPSSIVHIDRREDVSSFVSQTQDRHAKKRGVKIIIQPVVQKQIPTPSNLFQARAENLKRSPTLKQMVTQKRATAQEMGSQSERLAAARHLSSEGKLQEATDIIIATYRKKYENLRQKEKNIDKISSPRKQIIAKKVFNRLLNDLGKNIEDFRVEMVDLLAKKATNTKIEEASLHFQTIFNAGAEGIDIIILWGRALNKKKEGHYWRFISRYIEEAEGEENTRKTEQKSLRLRTKIGELLEGFPHRKKQR